MRIRRRHMGSAVGIAFGIHVAAAIAMVMEPATPGVASAGVGGIQVSLGPSGGAPGSAADVVSEIEVAELVVRAAAPQAPREMPPPEAAEVADVPLDTAPAAPAPPQTAAVSTEIRQAKVETPLAVAPVDAPIERAEVAEPVDEVTALARPEPVEAATPPKPAPAAPAALPESAEAPPPSKPEKIEVAEAEPVEAPSSAEATPEPEPVIVARAVEEAEPIDTPPLPVARPAPPKPEEPAPEPERVHVHQHVTATVPVEAPVAETARPAPAQTSGAAGRSGIGRSDRTGSAENSSGGGKPGVSVDYVSILQAWLEEHKEYPRRARSRRQEGVVWLYFVMDRAGRVLEHRIDRSSGFSLLDEEVREMIRRAQPLPAMPTEMTQARLELVVPVQFQLR